MTKLAPEWVRTSDPVIRSPARYRWTTAPAVFGLGREPSCVRGRRTSVRARTEVCARKTVIPWTIIYVFNVGMIRVYLGYT